jgi:hypothetical protein
MLTSWRILSVTNEGRILEKIDQLQSRELQYEGCFSNHLELGGTLIDASNTLQSNLALKKPSVHVKKVLFKFKFKTSKSGEIFPIRNL